MLHAFQKKTPRSAKQDIDLAAERYRALVRQRKKMSKRAKIEKGSGNVFADLGFPPEEAANLTLRSLIMMKLEDWYAASGFTQARAAKELGVTQPRFNDLLKRRIDKFSLDALVNMAARTGMRVEMRVKAPLRKAA